MKLLNPKEFKSLLDTEKDIEVKESYQRRQRILQEIAQFNIQKDTLKKGMKLLEEEFEKRCAEMLEEEKKLQKEIKELEIIKQNL